MAAKLESPANPPTGKRQSKTNDQIDSEMGKFIEAAAGPFTHGMTVEQLHAAITETNSQLLKAFDEFILGAREGGLVTPTRGENWKRQGNEAFKKKSYEQAILLYTRALHDLDDPAVISALLNNRATCLFHMELYPQCIADATASMHLTPTYLKAYYRRGNALQKIGVDEAVHDIEYSEAAPEGTEKGVYEKNAALCEKVEAILAGLPVGAQTEEIFLNKKLDLQYCWEKGRKLIANKSIEPGEVLITESAFAAGLRPEHLLTHCDFCLQHTPNLYTHRHLLSKKATFRSRGLYCSEACAQGAFDTYLELENKHPFFLVCPLDCLVAMRRVVRSRGDVKVKNAFVAAGQVKLDKDVRENPNNAALLKAATGTLVEHLEGFTHESEPTLSIGGNESAVACLAYHAGALAAVSLYSKGAKEGVDKLDASLATDGALESREALNAQPESDFVSIPELWEAADELKLAMRQIVTNGVGVSKLLQVGANAGSVENKTPVAAIMHSVEQTKVATALFPHVAMVNHSCQPNAFLNFVGAPATAHRTVHLRATKLISPGEDITISYGPHKNKIHSSKNRREALQNQYNFLCFCEACSTEVDEPLSEEKKELMVQASTYYQKGRTMMRNKRHADAIPAFEMSLDKLLNEIFIGKHRSSFVIGKTHDAAAECYATLGQYEKALNHCRQSAESVAYVNGEYEIETAHEYLKLSGLSAQCGRIEEAKKAHAHAEKIFNIFYGKVPIAEVEECRLAIEQIEAVIERCNTPQKE